MRCRRVICMHVLYVFFLFFNLPKSHRLSSVHISVSHLHSLYKFIYFSPAGCLFYTVMTVEAKVLRSDSVL